VDGVLTDGGFWWGPNGEEWKRFSFSDVMGLSLARKSGLILALISGEDTPLIDRYATKMLITNIYKGCKDKAAALTSFAEQNSLSLREICFIGDDVNDLSALKLAGLSAAPANAQPAVRDQVDFLSTRDGGNGAVREIVDAILAARAGMLEAVPR